MIYYDKIDVFEGIDVNKTNGSWECNILCYYFLYKGFRLQTYVSNVCRNLLMMFTNLDDLLLLKIAAVDYRCIIDANSKSEAVNLLENADFIEKSGTR